ncbi:MAG: N-acetylmuramoyl-L-alanine amidase [Lachnospiraceae bacterium]
MRKIKKITACLLAAVMLGGSLFSAQMQEVLAEETTITAADPSLVASGLSPAQAKVVVIDPGHCNKHPGAQGNGLKEEAVVLDISLACQEVLDTYGDVTVYMTREDGSCCRELELGDCLIARNNYAKQLDADFLVSMHINAGYTNGANVLAAYKSGYNDNIRKETQAFGRIALANLSRLGIRNRGFLLRRSETGNRYSNGKLADYYSIVRNGVIQNIPSVIIEHGYITSASDCNSFFRTKAKRTKVGKADADSIISYYGLSQKVINGTFTQEGDAVYYKTSDNKKITGWVKDDGTWYYFDKLTGKMQTGFLTDGENTFYLSPSTGEMVTGWFTMNGYRYLSRGNGTLVKGQAYSDGIHTYLFDEGGRQLKKGFHTVNGAVYYVDNKDFAVSGITRIGLKYYGFDPETKQMLYGYQKINGKYYYFDPDTGVAAKNEIVTIDNKTYYFGSKAARQTGLIKYKGSQYYFDQSSGKMVTGWKRINGNYYYFDKSSGKMQKSRWIGKYYVNSKGIRTKKK